jgi:hypothetical protein
MNMKYLFVIFMMFSVLGLDQGLASSFVREVEPGIVELKGALDGSLATQKVHIDKKKRWIYLEVKEGNNIRYFYAPWKDYSKLQAEKKFKSIQYGIGHRVQNSHGKIPFGTQRYFYPLVDYKSAS